MMTGNLRQLYREIRSCQGRLGTNAELPGDFEQVLRLAHDISNHLTVESMRAELQHPSGAPHRAASFRQWLKA